MNDFLKKVNVAQQKPDSFWAKLVNSLDKHEVPSSDMFDDLDDNYYDISEVLDKKTIYPGQIYYFDYQSKEPSEYEKKKKVQKFTDSSPLVLVFEVKDNYVRGINLNLCTNDLKALVLNVIVGLDQDYFNGGYAKMCAKKETPVSKKVYEFLQNGGEKQLKDALKRACPSADYNFIFRNYVKGNIHNAQVVGPYMWAYLPSISYGGEMKGKVITELQQMSGISKIKLH